MKKAFILKKIQCSKHTAHFLGDSNALLHEISDIHTQPNEKILKQLFFKKKNHPMGGTILIIFIQ